jgi:hypothetical protein
MIAFTLVAILLGMFTSAVGEFFVGVIAWTILSITPAVALTCAVYGRGDLRAFAMGALVPAAPIMLNGAASMTSYLHVLSLCIGMFVAGAVCGVAAVATRRWLATIDTD